MALQSTSPDHTDTLQKRAIPAAFRALCHRNYRLFWSGQVVSLIGTWVQNTAQGWLVMLLATNEYGKASSGFYVGLVGALGALPMFLLCLFAGVLSDHQDRRRILLITQSIFMLLALGLGFLVSTGNVHLWQVAIFSMLSGTVMAFDMPTRQAFIKDIASPEDLLNAIALNSTVFNLARIFGPAVAGYLIAFPHVGIPGALYINAASFLAVLIGIFFINVKTTVPVSRVTNLWKELGEGFRYAAGHPTIRALLIMMAVFSIFGFSYMVLLSVIAYQVLGVKADGYGWLVTATGVGATIGALLLASSTGRIRKGTILLVGGIICSLSLVGFSLCRNYYLAMPFLAGAGGGLVVCSASINSLIQEIVPDYIRGRVVSIWAFIFAGFTPIGSMYVGVVSRATSPGTAILTGALMCLSLMAIYTWKARWIWQLA